MRDFRRIIRRLCLSGATCLVAAPALAEPEYFACAITKPGRFFTDEMVFALDPDTGSGMVVDAMILYYNDGRGREARVTEATPRKTVFHWDMPMTNMSGQTAVMRFRAVLQRPAMRLLVSAQPSGFGKVFTGRGTCQPAEVELEGF